MDDRVPAHRIDDKGNIHYKAGRTPSEDGREFDAEKAKAIGLPKWGRVEIRLNGRHVLRKAARELHELADRLERLYGDLSRDETYLLREAHDEIRITANRLNPERCGPKPQHRDV
jgi:hypothetical protein